MSKQAGFSGMEETRTALRQAAPTPPTTRRRSSENQFPGKLHDMMTYVKNNDLESVISWVRSGTAIMIQNPSRLTDILPIFFGQTKYRSFRRQLNMWHFQRLLTGPDQGAFVHPFFIEGRKPLCAYMSRHIDPHIGVEKSPFCVADLKLAAAPSSTTSVLDDNSSTTSSSSSSSSPVLLLGGSPKANYIGSVEAESGLGYLGANNMMDHKVDLKTKVNLRNHESYKLEKGAAGLTPMITKTTTTDTRINKHDKNETRRWAASPFSLPNGGKRQNDAFVPTSTIACQAPFSSSPSSSSPSSSSPNDSCGGTIHTDEVLEAILPGLSIPASPEMVESIFDELNEANFW